MNRIAIIGSGITGLSVAFQYPLGSNITIFDKSRRPGGRISTRTSRQHEGYSFDHGVSFIDPSNELLQILNKTKSIQQVNVKQSQFGLKQSLEVTQKRMIKGNLAIQKIPINLIQQLSKTKNIQTKYNCRIVALQQKNNERNQYVLQSQKEEEFGPFHQVYFCLPFPQCRAIKQAIVKIADIQQPNYLCSWVVMVAFDSKSKITQQFSHLDVIRNISQNIQSMTSQRDRGNTTKDDLWVFRMTNTWSQTNKDLKPQQVQVKFGQMIRQIHGEQNKIKYVKAHRWLYSQPKNTPNQPIVQKNIILGGDWVGKKTNVQECWDLGKKLYNEMMQKTSL